VALKGRGSKSRRAHIHERRAYPRRQIAVPAFIVHRPGVYFACRVIDLGPNSARIEAEGVELPDRFVLLLKFSPNVQRDCRVVWRDGDVAGLHFRLWPVNKELLEGSPRRPV
jgi:PilZ domain